MARTQRNVPDFKNAGNWLDEPTRRRPTMTFRQKYEKGLFASEISTCFRAGRLDAYSTATTGGKSTRRVKQIAGKQRRQHHKREAREIVREA